MDILCQGFVSRNHLFAIEEVLIRKYYLIAFFHQFENLFLENLCTFQLEIAA